MAPPRFHEPELLQPVALSLPNGRLNRHAVGWSRHPLHDCRLQGSWPRKKRWDFWGVTTDTHMLAMTYGCADYMGTVSITWLEYDAGKRIEHLRLLPLAYGMQFPDTVGGGDMRYSSKDLNLAITEEPEGTRLRGWFRSKEHELEADVLIERPPSHETLNVVIPWSDERFQFTSKQNTRPARGTVRFDRRDFPFTAENEGYGCLDFGRGIWPFHTIWNWGAASGKQGEHVVGLNLGGKWTDGTGMTENGLCIDGRLHKISEPLTWEYSTANFKRPWRIFSPTSGRVDVEFQPTIEESHRIELGVIGTELHWLLGYYSGTIVTDSGERLTLDRLLGWAEEHRARW